jgi:CubicO group peptidase (beta-lactamase class C family)
MDSVPNSFDEVFSEGFNLDGPGIAVIVVKDGKTLFQEAFGLANVEKRVPIEHGMLFRIGSLTKPFTATAVMLLSDKGQLKVSDDITKYLPSYPTHGKKITIENLLTHTSGIINYTDLPEFNKNMARDLSLNELIGLFKSKPLDFEPGTNYTYSNSNYILLGAIIERISGQSYCSFMQHQLFMPLGMLNTKCENKNMKKMEVLGYSRNDKVDPISATQTYAAGALVSTVNDLALFNDAISSSKLLKQETWGRMFTAFVLKDGKSTKAGYGWGVGMVKGHPALGHEGKINGFSSMMFHLPEKRIFVAALSNDDRLHLFSEIESWFNNNSSACIAGQLAAIALEYDMVSR